MQGSKLYLNPIISKLRTQLLRVLIVDGIHPQAPRTIQVQRPVVNEKTLLRGALGDFQRDAKDRLLGLAGAHVTGAEENQKVSSKIEGLNAVFVELQRLIIDGADKVFPVARNLVQNGARLRVFFGVREHEGGELLAGEAELAIEQGPVEIFIQGDLSAVEGREREIVAVMKFLPIQVESVCGFFSRSAVPAICQDDAADVPEQRGDVSQGRSSSDLCLDLPSGRINSPTRDEKRNSCPIYTMLPSRIVQDGFQP